MEVSFQLDDDLLKALARKCPGQTLDHVLRKALRHYVSSKPVVSDKPVVRDPLTLSADQRDRVLRYAKRRGVPPQPQMMLSMCLDVGLDLFSLPPMYSLSDK